MLYAVAAITMTVLLGIALASSLRKNHKQYKSLLAFHTHNELELQQLKQQLAQNEAKLTVLMQNQVESSRQLQNLKDSQNQLSLTSDDGFKDAIRRVERGLDVTDLVDSGSLNKAEAMLIEQMHSH